MTGTEALDVLVVDDEPLARRGIRDLFGTVPGPATIREASSGGEGVRMIREQRPDLVLLDVQMPRMDGFGVIETIGAAEMPPVVFVTAHDEHALRAFEVHAVDYLLKPVDPERFRDAIDRARHAIDRDQAAGLRGALASARAHWQQARSTPAPAEPPRRLAVRQDDRIVFVEPGAIEWVEAQGNYAVLHLRDGVLRHRSTMEEMETLLGPSFVRIRRSVLLRTDAVRYCEPWGKGSYVFVLRDQTRLTSSRYFRHRLRPLLGN